jgi:hypothetical protein
MNWIGETMSEREELARLMAYSGRSPSDQARNADHFWGNTAESTKEYWLQIADRVIASGPSPRVVARLTAERDKLRVDLAKAKELHQAWINEPHGLKWYIEEVKRLTAENIALSKKS